MNTIFSAEFNEYQRQLFVRALQSLIKTEPNLLRELPGDTSTMIPNDNMLEEAQLMLGMLQDLPKDNEPGLTHGLCY